MRTARRRQRKTRWEVLSAARTAAPAQLRSCDSSAHLVSELQASSKGAGALIRPWNARMLKPGHWRKRKHKCRLHLQARAG
jgi:hypothetical protein